MDPSIQVTAMIMHGVRAGREAGYGEWIQGMPLKLGALTGIQELTSCVPNLDFHPITRS
jgi:hypothetical protein